MEYSEAVLFLSVRLEGSIFMTLTSHPALIGYTVACDVWGWKLGGQVGKKLWTQPFSTIALLIVSKARFDCTFERSISDKEFAAQGGKR